MGLLESTSHIKKKVTPLKYIVVSTPRSGTGYTAQVLSKLGLNCGHETYFRTSETIYQREANEIWGDSSWLAAPFISKLPPTTLVLHQLRDPIKTLDSMMARRQLRGKVRPEDKGPRGEYVNFLKTHFELGESIKFPQERLAHFWAAWHSSIETQSKNPKYGLQYFRFRVEDMNEELLLSIASLICDLSPRTDQLQAALQTSNEVNHRRGKANEIVKWAEKYLHSQENEAIKLVRSLSERYGY